ncbi:Rpn family recombination-promoting nuclease/putative transposase [Treponema primitia]|uniref:Rpn family recombination-promoting nuclease/putative transposase n=1 Tax=Treponema primitia TaxID=88058 RepID=UPI001FE12770|nr:Rpn family recombination-promoting nuclease/putative transposase [Treponema primitia]
MNAKYKDSVFTKLFNDEDRLRELYAALEGIEYDPSISITINTLEDVLYMDRINDLSFTAGDKLVFVIEHQSTLNWNMPLRILSYIARVYEKIISRRALYKTTLVKIPKPEFIVLYNGPEKAPEKWELRLSDAFIGLEPGEKVPLDLIVTVYNINYGQNTELLQRSENLSGYAQFVAKVRENEAVMPLEQAVTEAVQYCIKNRILERFFEEHGGEVLNMAFGEWDWDEAKAAWQEEVWEEAEAKYQPILAENQQALAENQQALAEKDRENQELRRKLQEAGIDT